MAGSDPPDHGRPDQGKGKGRDDAPPRTPRDPTAAPPSAEAPAPASGAPSVLSRIAQSAAGLGRDLMAARPAGGDLAMLASSTDKAGPATGGRMSAASHGESTATQGAEAGRWGSRPGDSSGAGAGHAQQHATAQEAAFAQFLDDAPVDMTTATEGIVGLDSYAAVTDVTGVADVAVAEAAWARARAPAPALATPEAVPSSAVAEQERRDGLDVVFLLSAEGPPEPEPDYDAIELAEHEVAALKRALFGDSEATSSAQDSSSASASTHDWDTVLNFIPDFVRPGQQGYEGQADAATASKSRETQAALGLPHTAEASRQWLDQWHSVLTRYDDEVWGGLTSLVAQARDELDQLQQAEPATPAPAQPPPSTKALERLRQILGHLRDDRQ